MAGLKSITDLPMAESTSGVNLIVNDNGVAKQADLNAVRAEQEYDLVFKYFGHPTVQRNDMQYLICPPQEDFKKFCDKVKNKQNVKALFRIDTSENEHGYNQVYYADIPLQLSATTEGWCSGYGIFMFEDEGSWQCVISIHFNEEGVSAFYFEG